ncbi:MAG: N-acetyltransferase [Pseudomonadota bacterium]|nr:N-acetyltransferase [Pseudomonadota bacterium]
MGNSQSRPAADIGHREPRFTVTVDGVQAHLDYRREDGRMTITHTIVPDEIGGRGIAGRLTRAAFEHARTQGWKVRPACSYAAAWAERHPEFADVLD